MSTLKSSGQDEQETEEPRERCDWCGETTDEIEIEMSGVDDRYVPVDVSTPPGTWETNICQPCADRLAQHMCVIRSTLGLKSSESRTELAKQMVHIVDAVNLEPQGRDWEDTLP